MFPDADRAEGELTDGGLQLSFGAEETQGGSGIMIIWTGGRERCPQSSWYDLSNACYNRSTVTLRVARVPVRRPAGRWLP